MKTIKIYVCKGFINEARQIELEKNLANLEEITDFVFTETYLEVTYNEKDPFNTDTHICNLCNIQIQSACYASGQDLYRDVEQLFI